MALKLSLVTSCTVLCFVIRVQCDSTNTGLTSGMQENVRVKRAKYYSNPPQRFYRLPPASYPVQGAFSHTPPPSHMRPINQGLSDQDLNRLIKYLSKQDLAKIIELAVEKEKKSDRLKETQFDKYHRNHSKAPERDESQNFFKLIQEVDTDNLFSNDDNRDISPYNIEFNKPALNYFEGTIQPNVLYETKPQEHYNKNKVYPSTILETEETMRNHQYAYIQDYNNEQINRFSNSNYPNKDIYTESNMMKEEQLPRPANLREDQDDVLGEFTNNVPTVIRASSYEVEDLGGLPLMKHNSKLHTVSSYHVPHYTVTSHRSKTSLSPSHAAPPSSPLDVPLEPAPPVSAALEQSDAHLKATDIWTHRSKGTAYTLHDDGTLSLERQPQPKTKYR